MNITNETLTCVYHTACQMWCLGRFLHLIIGDLVPYEDPHWDNYIMLLDIVDEVFAPITTPDRADYVAMLVEDFLECFKELYPSRPVTPKMHYMVHMPSWMKWYNVIISMFSRTTHHYIILFTHKYLRVNYTNCFYPHMQMWSTHPSVVYAL